MNIDALESLTPRQRECLRLVTKDRSTKEIARELGISPETVNNHLKAAMGTLRISSRFTAARAFREFEQIDLLEASPPQAMVPDLEYGSVTAMPVDGVQEERGFYDPRRAPGPAGEGLRRYQLSVIQRLLCIALLTATTAVLAVAALPMSDSVQRLANWLEPPVNR